MSAVELKPCPFCGDPMEAHDSDGHFYGFTHTEAATDGKGTCFLRHTYYPIEVAGWWNTRAPIVGTDR